MSKNLTYLRKKNKRSSEFVASVIGISRQTLTQYEHGTAEPKASILKSLAELYKTTLDSLVNVNLEEGNGTTTDFQNSNFRILIVTASNPLKEKIELVPIEAQAGYLQAFQEPSYISELTTFSLPKHYEGKYRAFEIKGDSMPPINHGFIVIGQYVETWSGIKSNQRYILVTKNDGVVFKRVFLDEKNEKNLILISDNKDYNPYSLHASELLEAWLFVSFIGFPDK